MTLDCYVILSCVFFCYNVPMSYVLICFIVYILLSNMEYEAFCCSVSLLINCHFFQVIVHLI